MYDVQVDAKGYESSAYMTPSRWTTTSLLVREVLRHVDRGSTIVEIGPGSGLLTTILRSFGYAVKTVDIDPAVKPDVVGDITSVDVIGRLSSCDALIASEIFEHITYDDFMMAIERLRTLCPKLFLTLPHTTVRRMFFGFSLKLPKLQWMRVGWKWSLKKRAHTFNGQHYWELGTKQHSVGTMKRDVQKHGWQVSMSYINPDNPYHHFFYLTHKER